MGKSPVNVGARVSDAALAQNFIKRAGYGETNVKVMLARVHGLLAQMFPHSKDRKRQWTERRVRAFWNREAATVQHSEMVELFLAAERAEADRAALQHARKEHAEFIAQTARLRALLEHQDEAFHSAHLEGLGRVIGGVDRA